MFIVWATLSALHGRWRLFRRSQDSCGALEFDRRRLAVSVDCFSSKVAGLVTRAEATQTVAAVKLNIDSAGHAHISFSRFQAALRETRRMRRDTPARRNPARVENS